MMRTVMDVGDNQHDWKVQFVSDTGKNQYTDTKGDSIMI